MSVSVSVIETGFHATEGFCKIILKLDWNLECTKLDIISTRDMLLQELSDTKMKRVIIGIYIRVNLPK